MQQRTALQSSMGIGEKPAQGAMFPEFHGEGFKEPLTKPVSKGKEFPMDEFIRQTPGMAELITERFTGPR